MSRHTQGNSVEASGDQIWNNRTLAEDQRQRSRPKPIHQCNCSLVNVSRILRRGFFLSEMYNQWVKVWTVFDCEDLCNRAFVQRIGPQAIDSFSGKGDQFTCPKLCYSKSNGLRIGAVENSVAIGKVKGKSQKVRKSRLPLF